MWQSEVTGWDRRKRCEVHPQGRGNSGDSDSRCMEDKGQRRNRYDEWGGVCLDNEDEVRSRSGEGWGVTGASGPE